MKNRFELIFTLVLSWLVLCSAGIKFSHLTIKDGLSQSSIKCIYQDSKGFLWFGTADGLNKYDGYEFKIYRNNPTVTHSLSGNDITCVFENPGDSTLWIGTQGFGINIYSRDKDLFCHFNNEPDNILSLSGNNIRDITSDHLNNVWIATLDGGMCRFNPLDSTFLRPAFQSKHAFNKINCLKFDDSQNFWIGTTNGLYKWDKMAQLNDLEPIKIQLLEDNINPNITAIQIDLKGNLWVGTQNSGLFKFHPGALKLANYDLSKYSDVALSNHIRDILLTKNGSIWIGTMNGLFKYNSKENEFEIFEHIPTDEESLNNEVIYSLLEDRAGLMWIGTYLGGINKIDPIESRFKKYSNFFNANTHSGYNNIGVIAEDENETIWLKTSKGLLGIKREYFLDQKPEKYISRYLDDENIGFILAGPNHTLWASSQNEIYLKDKSNNFKPVANQIDKQTGLKIRSFNAGLIDSDNKTWLMTGTGFIKYDPDSGLFKAIKYQNTLGEILNIFPLCCLENYSGQLLIGTFIGQLFRFNRHNERMEQLIPFKEDKGIVAFSKIFSVYETAPGILWLGTNMGLYKFNYETNEIKRYLDNDGLANNVVYAVLGDSKGQIWCSTNSGISVFIPEENTFRTYTYKDGLQSNEFNQSAYLKSKSGAFYMGGINGFNIFHPELIFPNGYIPQVVITGLEINNEKISPSTHEKILSKQISEINRLNLNYKQKNLRLEYRALSYSQPEKNRYKYMLQGYDNEWINAGSMRTAVYTNLSPGEYFFRVKGSNNDGKWNETPASIHIIIRPPFWNTWLFIIAFFVFILMLIYLTFYLRLRSIKQQKKLLEKKVEEKTITLFKQKEQIENQNRELKLNNEKIVRQNEKIKRKNQLLEEQTNQIIQQRDNLLQMAQHVKEANQAKLRFFTSISHELRTPLTLIISPIKDILLHIESINTKEISRKLNTVYLNASKLLLIVNQLLDFRKTETDNMKMRVSKFDLVSFVQQTAFLFNDLAAQKSIQFSFESKQKKVSIWADQDKLEKIIYNLLSNAFKFTPDSGNVSINISTQKIEGEEETATITVKDNGAGIDEDKIPYIFERFFQLEQTSEMKNTGSGLGLALVKKYVDLHKGKIIVQSTRGIGSQFIVHFPLGKKHFDENIGFIHQDTSGNKELLRASIGEYTISAGKDIETKVGNKPLLLIIEDDKDLRLYLKETLAGLYKIEVAENGKHGIQMAGTKNPDLIICDVMLPDLSGFELCSHLKGDFKTSHLPVILLTALAGQENQMSGLKAGADAYITKPFDLQYLILCIDNLIEGRKKLQKRFSAGDFYVPEDINLTSPDQIFLNDAVKFVEENMSNFALNVELLCASLKLSQPQVYRKIKALSGLNISEFIRNIRLRKAAQLLKSGRYKINEVAYEVGFNDPNYFTKAFIKLFETTPTDYLKSL